MAKKNLPIATSDGYDVMAPRWDMIDALLGGTETLREAAEEYLPRHEGETSRQYNERLAVATLFNMFEETLGALTGRVFKGPVALGEDVEDDIAELMDNVDGQGTNLTVFAASWFRQGLGKAFAHVFVDFPGVATDAEGNPVTNKAEEVAQRRVPFARMIPPENVLDIQSEFIDGKEVLTMVRILEHVEEREGWLTKCQVQVRVLIPGGYEIYRPDPKRKNVWNKYQEGKMDIERIPFVTFYAAKREGNQCAKPQLLDLAYLNIAHWQSTSDQRVATTVARFPILAGEGTETPGATPDDDPGADVVVGPKQFLGTSKLGAKYYFVEHTGAAIEAGRKDLADLEQQMSAYGAEFLRKKPGSQTATERALDSSENTCELELLSLVFKDSLENMLQLFAEWLDKEDGGSVVLTTDFSEAPNTDAPALDTLNKARDRKDLSRVTYLNELKRRNILAEEVDAEDEERDVLDETDLELPEDNPEGGGPGQKTGAVDE